VADSSCLAFADGPDKDQRVLVDREDLVDVFKSAQLGLQVVEADIALDCARELRLSCSNLGRELLPLPELAAWLRRRKARGRAALLFGSEKTGLGNEEMSHCHALVRIPTTQDCPSMNLGQAVAVCAYEMVRSDIVSVRPPRLAAHPSEPANQQTLLSVFERAAHLLDLSGYLQPKSRAAMLRKLRRLLLDLDLTSREARILGGVLAQVEWKLDQTGKSKL